MPPMDFPFPALAGDKYPVPPIPNQPVYTFDGVKWTTFGDEADDVIGASTSIPLPDGVGSAGTEDNWARGDHVHPAVFNDIVLTGTTTAPTPPLGDNDTSIATTAFVQSAVTATEIGTSVLVGSTAPVGAADNSLWFEDDTGRLYLFYNDGTGPSQWIAAAPAPDAISSRYGIYAAPFDTMAYSGMQVNGSMEVSQELAMTGVTATGLYGLDGWKLYRAGTSATRLQQALVGVAGIPSGFTNSMVLNVQTGEPSLAAGSYVGAVQNIEGYRVARLSWGTSKAKSITIGFWSWNSGVGPYTVSIRNTDNTRSYCTTYNQSVSVAPQYNAITIPGCTDGTWSATSTVGMSVTFTAASGSTGTAPVANVWQTGNFIAAPGQVNGVTATNNQLVITGVVVLPGMQYPEAEQSALVMRPYDQELVTCKRYFQKFTSIIVDTSAASHSTIFPVEMRIAPVVTGGGAGFAASNSNTVSAQFSQTTRAAQTLVLDARL